MERLKTLLRLALSQQAQCLVLRSGKIPELTLASGRIPVAGQEPITMSHVQSLFSQLLAKELPTIAAFKPAHSYLQIPNVGRIELLAVPAAQPSLLLYLPGEGSALFAAEWPKYQNQALPLALASGDAMLPPLPLQAAFRPQQVSSIPPPLAFTSQSPTSIPPPATPEPMADMGYIPAGLLGQTPELRGTAQIKLAAPPAATTPQETPRPLLVTPPLAVDQGQNFNHQNDLQHLPSQSYLGHFGVNTTEASQQVILFGPDASGNAGISDGENPIDDILTDMIKRKASDVHMTCGEPLCMRIDGDITRIGTAALTPEDLERLLLPMIPPRNKTEFSASNDTDFAYEIRGIGRFRVNLFRDKNGAGAVMRHIPSTILTAEQLKLPPAITKFCSLSKGLVLVTGPTGSGKSTTLAAMIDLINKERADHILTVEDPIEFVHPQHKCLINQREVHKHTGSFARALKAALREDPDIVLIGEMRDLETVAIAIETAETGHLVFGTLHTNTAVSTIDRIIDQFPTDQQAQIRMMLAASLRGVVAQTLLKKKKGGRVAAHEILVTNDAVSAMIREGKNHMIGNHMQSQKADGNLLLNDSLLKLVKEGIVDIDEAMRKSVDRSSFIEAAKRQGGAQPAQAAAPSRPPGGGNPTGR